MWTRTELDLRTRPASVCPTVALPVAGVIVVVALPAGAPGPDPFPSGAATPRMRVAAGSAAASLDPSARVLAVVAVVVTVVVVSVVVDPSAAPGATARVVAMPSTPAPEMAGARSVLSADPVTEPAAGLSADWPKRVR